MIVTFRMTPYINNYFKMCWDRCSIYAINDPTQSLHKLRSHCPLRYSMLGVWTINFSKLLYG